jgi:threonine synthase
MGLPTDKLIIATNSNDILARFWKTGRYERVGLEAETAAAPASGISDGKDAVKETLSPAMDILISSNFERLLWYLASEAEGGGTVDDACAVVDGWMKSVKSNGRVEVPRKALELAKRDFIAERVSDDQVRVFGTHRSTKFQRTTYTDIVNDKEAL